VRRLTQADVKFFNRARLPEPGAPVASVSSGESGGMSYGGYKTISAVMEELDSAMIERFEALHAALMALGDDVRFDTPVSCSASSCSICSTPRSQPSGRSAQMNCPHLAKPFRDLGKAEGMLRC
jgi:hypothetical protein